MVDSPRLTVVIPTYKRSQLLKEAIKSVHDQTFTDYCVLIADNASSDESRNLVESLHDSRYVYHRHARNIGPNYNFRYVLETPRTEFIAFLSDDDLLMPDHLATAVDALNAYPQAAYYASHAVRFGHGEEEIYEPPTILKGAGRFTYTPPGGAVRFLGMDTPGLAHFVAHRSAVQKIQYWDSADFLATDILIMPQMMIYGGFVFGHQPTTRVRQHDTTVSNVKDSRDAVRFNLMVWSAIRHTTDMLLAQKICSVDDISAHGLHSDRFYHVIPLVLALGSFHSTVRLRNVAHDIFRHRRDMDSLSARFMKARSTGFWVIPVSELISEWRCRWHPKR